MTDLLERFDALRAAVRISIRQELADHYDMNLGECYLFLDADAERIRDFKHIQASYVVAANARIAELEAEIDSWEAASVAKTAEVAAVRARIALLEAVAEAGRSLPASMNQGYPPIDTALAALDAAKEPKP